MNKQEILRAVKEKMVGGELTVPIVDLARQLGLSPDELRQLVDRWRMGEFS
ncbi:MAG: hypothetical protein ACM3ZQ_05155 [Bacillota bacterium]